MRASGQVKSKRCYDEDLERALCNWARWVVSKGGDLRAFFPNADLVAGRQRMSETPLPTINGEAVELDSIIQDRDVLPLRYNEVIQVWYVLQVEPPVAARRCRCCIQTFYNRLEHAWGLISRERAARHRASLILAEHYRATAAAAAAARSAC